MESRQCGAHRLSSSLPSSPLPGVHFCLEPKRPLSETLVPKLILPDRSLTPAKLVTLLPQSLESPISLSSLPFFRLLHYLLHERMNAAPLCSICCQVTQTTHSHGRGPRDLRGCLLLEPCSVFKEWVTNVNLKVLELLVGEDNSPQVILVYKNAFRWKLMQSAFYITILDGCPFAVTGERLE